MRRATSGSEWHFSDTQFVTVQFIFYIPKSYLDEWMDCMIGSDMIVFCFRLGLDTCFLYVFDTFFLIREVSEILNLSTW